MSYSFSSVWNGQFIIVIPRCLRLCLRLPLHSPSAPLVVLEIQDHHLSERRLISRSLNSQLASIAPKRSISPFGYGDHPLLWQFALAAPPRPPRMFLSNQVLLLTYIWPFTKCKLFRLHLRMGSTPYVKQKRNNKDPCVPRNSSGFARFPCSCRLTRMEYPLLEIYRFLSRTSIIFTMHSTYSQ